MNRTNAKKISRTDNFIDGFQKDHKEILELTISFRNAIESTDLDKAKDVLNRIDTMLDGHFSFEETYLYPRLQRLISEITGNLRNEQQMIKEFVGKSRNILNKNKLSKNEALSLLDMLPRISKTLDDCDGLVFLAEKFDKEDKEDLNLRFKQCLDKKSAVCV